jgi:AcrR family transcriptional regulator
MPRGRPREFDIDRALDAALMVFWRHGYEGATLAALTDAMGINSPSLYATFGSKEKLFQKALERYLRGPASYLPEALKAPTARQAIEELFRGAIDMVMNPRHPDGCMLVQGALACGPMAEGIRNELNRGRAAAETAVRRRFERAIAERELTEAADPATLARFVVTLLWGLSVQAAGGATRAQLQEVADLAMHSWPQYVRKA